VVEVCWRVNVRLFCMLSSDLDLPLQCPGTRKRCHRTHNSSMGLGRVRVGVRARTGYKIPGSIRVIDRCAPPCALPDHCSTVIVYETWLGTEACTTARITSLRTFKLETHPGAVEGISMC
jgi:hypothetical protein